MVVAFSPIQRGTPFAPSRASSALSSEPVIGAGGMADTRDPDALVHDDPRKSISDAPSFEEYLKQRAGGDGGAAPAAAPSPPAADPVAAQPATTAAPAAAVGGDPIALLDSSQAALVDKIAAAIPDLEAKPDLSWTGETLAGTQATLDARDAPGPANVAWLGSVCIPGKLSSLTIFNGPLTDVPHLLSRCLYDKENNQLQFALDFRPRAYGAYEMVDAQGNYPGPEELGRKAFEYSGARSDFFNKFATTELQAEFNIMAKSLEDATPSAIQPSELDLLTGSPVAISLTMPATDQNAKILSEMREKAAETWLEWATDDSGEHAHRPGAPINTQYVYDAKMRQNAYLALRDYYTSTLGAADGNTLAAAESGPLDEAYVGGGS